MRRTLTIYLWGIMAFIGIIACTNEERPVVHTLHDNIRLHFSRASNLAEENEITDLCAILFSPEGMFQESFHSIQVKDNQCNLALNYQDQSVLVFLANVNGLINVDSLCKEKISLETLKALTVSVLSENKTQQFMTGELTLTSSTDDKQVELVRGVARFDLSKAPETKVYEISISGLAANSYLMPSSEKMDASSENMYAFTMSDKEGAIENKEGITYVWEQNTSEGALVTAKVSIAGVSHVLTQHLPVIDRNKVYTIRVKGTGIDAQLDIEENDWEEGEHTEATPSDKVWVEVPSTQPNNLLVEGNEVHVPYVGVDNAKIILKMQDGSIVQQEGISDEIKLQSTNDGNYEVTINSKHRQPGAPENIVYFRVYNSEKKQLLGNVKVQLDTNPVLVNGSMAFNEDFTYDAATYIDGELGEMVLPSGYTLTAEAPAYTDENVQWLKIIPKPDTENTYRVVAGWRPNDVKAKGEVQTAVLHVKNTEKNFDEVYYIKRRNWALPVIQIQGVWWCKYNLRGNAKSFEDQVSVEKDLEIQKQGDFATYLIGCSNEDFMDLAGDQYIGGKTQGLKIAQAEDGTLYYNGYNASGAVDFGSLPATQMAPSGYQIPSYNNYRFFTWSENSNMGYHDNVFNNGMKDEWTARIKYSIRTRDLTTSTVKYGPVMVYKFWIEDKPEEEWVLYGLGHQWEENKISPMYILFAVANSQGKTWGMEGYESSRNENWYKYTNHNQGKTRTIRCVKTPVEFTY